MFKKEKIVTSLFWVSVCCHAQHFERIPTEEVFSGDKKIQFREILTTSKGDMFITASMNFAEISGGQFTMNFPMGGLTDSKGNPVKIKGNSILNDTYNLHTGFKSTAVSADDIIYVLSDNNNFGFLDYKIGYGFAAPPFNFPRNRNLDITKIWLDNEGDLFVAAGDTIYIIKEVTKIFQKGTRQLTFKSGLNKDSTEVITEGARKIEKFSLGKKVFPYCFANCPSDNATLIGTNKGIFEFDKKDGSFINLFSALKEPITVTYIHCRDNSGYIWFSTLEKGMGSYSLFSKTIEYYPYKMQLGMQNPVQTFTPISSEEFLVALTDSVPAIFNTETDNYEFINDTSFSHSGKGVTDIKTGSGNLTVLIKGGDLYWSKDFLKNRRINNNYPVEPYLKEILIEGKPYKERINYQIRTDSVKMINLKYYENHIDIFYAAKGVNTSDTVVFAWKMDGLWDEWQQVALSMMDERLNMTNFDLKPGHYVFRVKMKKGNGTWLKNELALTIIIHPPFWQTWWFWLLVVAGFSLVTYLITSLRTRAVRIQERQKAKHEKEILELEAKALRAQMNPHFIFNCLNSIKALIQNNQKQKSVDYLTTFSKLIRTLFQNSDKRQISLFDEIETCRLYTQLEAMRLNGNLTYNFDIDPNLDLKSVMVPALIIQPFIENAIWHGIVPKEEGTINVNVKGDDNAIMCEVDDDGIGRERSKLNKPITPVMHESKGVNLSQARLNLQKMLNETNASIETIDKYESNQPTGTRVVITFNLS